MWAPCDLGAVLESLLQEADAGGVDLRLKAYLGWGHDVWVVHADLGWAMEGNGGVGLG